MNYLALDQAPSKVGWALGSAHEKPEWDVYFISTNHREASLRDWLQSMVSFRGVYHVVYEAPFIGPRSSPQDVIAMCGLPAIIRLVCDDHGVPCEAAPLDQWRKHFIGYTRAPKEVKGQSRRRRWIKDACMRSCVERDWHVTDDDSADALGILDWALCRDFPQRGSDTAALFRELKGTENDEEIRPFVSIGEASAVALAKLVDGEVP